MTDSPDGLAETPPPRRPSRVRYLFMLFAGMLIGRVASTQFAPGLLDAVDLVMYGGLALSIVWAWRSWARGAMEQRHRDALRRREARDASRDRE
ncbi:MAG: hypothetical protein WD058_03250 [Dehalococcoidia bacterium]